MLVSLESAQNIKSFRQRMVDGCQSLVPNWRAGGTRVPLRLERILSAERHPELNRSAADERILAVDGHWRSLTLNEGVGSSMTTLGSTSSESRRNLCISLSQEQHFYRQVSRSKTTFKNPDTFAPFRSRGVNYMHNTDCTPMALGGVDGI